jgi:phenylacetate-CoA ligase
MNYYDSLETRSPGEREASLMARLPQQVAHAKSSSTYFGRLYAGFDAQAINSRQALARLPLTRKTDLHELQRAALPFGGLTATPLSALSRVFASPGPIYDPEGRGQDWWRFARVLFAAGFRAGELIHNTFSYHFTPAGFMLEGAAQQLGCPVFPAGVGQTEMQVQVIADLKPVAYVGTPSFLRIIFDKADELGADVSSLRKAVLSGEALPAALRQSLNERGMVVRQAYATADLGVIAYETPSEEGLVVEEEILLEIVRPGTGDPVADGEVGEGSGDWLQRGLPIGPLCHRRLVGGSARRQSLRPDQRPHQGLAGASRPDDQSQGHVRTPFAGCRNSHSTSGH